MASTDQTVQMVRIGEIHGRGRGRPIRANEQRTARTLHLRDGLGGALGGQQAKNGEDGKCFVKSHGEFRLLTVSAPLAAALGPMPVSPIPWRPVRPPLLPSKYC